MRRNKKYYCVINNSRDFYLCVFKSFKAIVLKNYYLTKQPSMQERVYILQCRFLLHSYTLPDNTLLSQLLIYIRRSNNHSQHYTLSSRLMEQNAYPTLTP